MINVTDFITEQANAQPGKMAIHMAGPKSVLAFKKKNTTCTFDELEKRINITCNALKKAGLKDRSKILVFIPPGLELVCLTFSLLKMGVIPIFIDPGMGKESLLKCIEKVDADAIIGIAKIFYLKKINSKSFKSIKISVCTDSALWGDHSLNKLKMGVENKFESLKKDPNDLAAILFTSGATGIPKGVEYSMQMFVSQVTSLKEIFNLNSTDNDFGGYSLFSLFTLCMGATSFIPSSIDPKVPAKTNPAQLLKELKQKKITFATGSPSIWKKLITYCEKKKVVLEDMKALVMFGAPVSGQMIRKLSEIMPKGRIYTPYGATESLPLSIIDSNLILGETFELTQMGRGVCVGYPVRDVSVKILPITNEVIDELPVENAEVGEICVNSPMTSKAYHLYEKNHEAKIIDEGETWHRMGDLGYIDSWGRLWYFGRKKHLITFKGQDFYSTSIEGIFNSYKDVENSALIKINEMPAVALILKNKAKFLSADEKEELRRKLSLFAQRFKETKEIKNFIFLDEFPVDTRHNIKIDRIKLSKMHQGE